MAKKSNFDLISLMNQRPKEPDAETAYGQEDYEMDTTQGVADIYELVPSKQNFYGMREIQELKQAIELVGLLQPLLVLEPEGNNKDKIVIAGHRRLLALKELVKEGKDQYRQVPIQIKKRKNDILDRLALIMANKFRVLTEWERMTEAIETENLAKQLKQYMDIPGRTRDILAEIVDASPVQLGRYKAINNNLCPELMAAFKANVIGVSVAFEASGLSDELQKQAASILDQQGVLTLPDVRDLKSLAEKVEKIPGQESFDLSGQIKSDEKNRVNGAGNSNIQEKQSIESQEEYIHSLCYTCESYQSCYVKAANLKSCFNYKKSVEMPEQQKYKSYDKEQVVTDNGIKEKVPAMECEQNNTLPNGGGELKEVIVSPPVMQEIMQEQRSYLIVRDQKYCQGEIVRLIEHNGRTQNQNMLKVKIVCMDDETTSSGIKEGYCVIQVRNNIIKDITKVN